MLLWNNHPNREAVKAAAELIAESRAATDLNESTSELSVRIRADARHDALAAIFHELPPMSDDAQTHTAQ